MVVFPLFCFVLARILHTSYDKGKRVDETAGSEISSCYWHGHLFSVLPPQKQSTTLRPTRSGHRMPYRTYLRHRTSPSITRFPLSIHTNTHTLSLSSLAISLAHPCLSTPWTTVDANPFANGSQAPRRLAARPRASCRPLSITTRLCRIVHLTILFHHFAHTSVDRRGVDVDPFILWLSLVTLKMLSLAALSNAPLKEAQLLCVIAFRFPLFMIPVPLCLVLLRSWRVLSSWSHPYLCLASQSSPCSISFRPHLYYTFNLVSERFVHDSQALQRALEGHHHRLALSRRHGWHLLSFRFIFPVHSCPRPFTIASALTIACEHSVLGPCSSSLTPAQNPTPHSNSC
ncbi:hypothetical protein EDB86DRAFT_1660626 [Lactarius hatsudake]|nr:hypothetical protein EDB86DRAFT_1660626 [Lactarius hatsudake]